MKQLLYVLLLAPVMSLVSFITFNDARPPVKLVSTTFTNKKWVLDKAQSVVSFSVTHMMVRKSEGVFKRFDGTMECTKPDFSDAKISFTVDATSIDTDNEDRDKHLRSEDYFNSEKYPTIRFESTSFKPAGGKKYTLTGNLTLKDVTKPVVFNVIYDGTTSPDKGGRATFKCSTVINRYDYNINSGGPAISKEVTINVKAEMK